jgi:hypothetical protein
MSQLRSTNISKIVIALAQGPHIDAAIGQAIVLAQQHDAELCGVAIIDAPWLSKVGPVPIGAGDHARKLREWRISKARKVVEEVIELFESQAKAADVKWSVRLEEGKPPAVLRSYQNAHSIVAVAPGGWFDQGVLDQGVDVPRHLVSGGIYPLLILGTTPREVSRIRFVHDGSARSLSTWRWLIESNLWPEATLIIEATPDIKLANVEQALQEARSRNRRAEQAEAVGDPREFLVIGNASGRSWLPKWLKPQPTWDDERVLALG